MGARSPDLVQLAPRAAKAVAVSAQFLGEMVLPGMASSVPLARHFVGHALATAGHQGVDGVRLVTSELATNAVVHSQSGWPGGLIAVEVTSIDSGLARIEVTDEGGTTFPRPREADDGECHGRGLRLVDQMAQRWGVRLNARGWKTVWAEVLTTEDAPIGLLDAASYLEEMPQ